MIEFEEAYFQEEVREGFRIPEMMKRVWAVQQEVLAEVIRVCKKYHITYYAAYGTLLGAVRHHGYIPWDDDIDIMVKAEDFKRLFGLLPLELPKSWGVHSIYTEETHGQPLGCVTNSRVINTDPRIVESFHGCPYIVGIDIFPLYYIPRDPELAEGQKTMYWIVYDLAQSYNGLTEEHRDYRLEEVEKICNVTFDRSKPIKCQLWRLADRIASMFSADESDHMVYMPDVMALEGDRIWKKEWLKDTIEMPFEKLMLDIPAGYDGILTKRYGDYMTPSGQSGGHDYPFYKKQQEFLDKLQK